MKEILLTNDKTAMVDDEDYEYINQYKWFAVKRRKTFYAMRHIFTDKASTILMHRDILRITDPKIKIDHADHMGLNNQKSNIRQATNSQSMANRGVFKRASSKYFGVHWHKLGKKWQARICKDRKTTYLGLHDTEESAAIAYNLAAIKLHGEFANLNIF